MTVEAEGNGPLDHQHRWLATFYWSGGGGEQSVTRRAEPSYTCWCGEIGYPVR